jgi:hypothetical protein
MSPSTKICGAPSSLLGAHDTCHKGATLEITKPFVARVWSLSNPSQRLPNHRRRHCLAFLLSTQDRIAAPCAHHFFTTNFSEQKRPKHNNSNLHYSSPWAPTSSQ